MKKILLIMLLVFLALLFVGCDIEQASAPNLDDKKNTDVTVVDNAEKDTSKENNNNDCFFPGEKTNLHLERFEKTLKETLNSIDNATEYEIIGNYVPIEKSNLYDFDAFIVKISGEYCFFVWYNNKIYSLSPIYPKDKDDYSFVHFLVTDINNDGYIEIMTSMNMNENREISPYSFSYVSIIDGKTEKREFLHTIYNGFAYFKEDDKGLLGVYKSDVKTINSGSYDTSNTLVCNLIKNDYNFSFKENTYEVISDNFKATINIEEDDFYFPVLAEYYEIGFTVNVVMTYLGESFSYTNGTGYLAGASCTFINGDNIIMCDGWGETTVVTKFFVNTNMVIDRTYKYSQSVNNLFNEGTYDMVIAYRGESVTVEDFLTISKN